MTHLPLVPFNLNEHAERLGLVRWTDADPRPRDGSVGRIMQHGKVLHVAPWDHVAEIGGELLLVKGKDAQKSPPQAVVQHQRRTVPEPHPMVCWSYEQVLDFLHHPSYAIEGIALPGEWLFRIQHTPETRDLVIADGISWVTARNRPMDLHPIFQVNFRTHATPLTGEQLTWYLRAVKHKTDPLSALELCKQIHPDRL